MPLRSFILTACLLLMTWWLATPFCHAAEPLPDESQVKAALVFNIAKFVDWPAASFAQDSSPLVICTLGSGGFVSAVADLQGKQLKGHPVAVTQISRAEEIRTCHLLVIGNADAGQVQSVLFKLRSQPVLSISDRDRFAHSGGVVGLYRQSNKVKFEVNLQAAQQRQLKISSHLLKLARIVGQEQP